MNKTIYKLSKHRGNNMDYNDIATQFFKNLEEEETIKNTPNKDILIKSLQKLINDEKISVKKIEKIIYEGFDESEN